MPEATLLERNQGILARLANLRTLEPKLRQIYLQGKREHLLQGMSAGGLRFAPLEPSTLKHRRGGGPPLAPLYDSSEIIAAYRVDFSYTSSSVIVSAGWPMDWVKYHRTGTKRMSKRDPSGFRPQDKAAGIKLMREYLFRG